MYPLSANFRSSLLYSHRMTTRIEVYSSLFGERIYNSGDLTYAGGLIEGEVSVDDADIRRRISCRFIDPTGTLTPSNSADIFTPFGHEMRAYRGIVFADGTTEEIPLGVFGISDVESDDSGPGVQISVTAYDRARRVTRAKPTQDYVIAAGTNYATAIQDLIQFCIGPVGFSFATTGYTTPQIVIKAGDDPWKAAREMAASIGCDLYFGPTGTCILENVLNYSEAAAIDWTYAEGATATILYTNKRLTNDDAFNYFIVTGESSGNAVPVRADASDVNTASATYIYGPYGIQPAPIESSKLVTTAAQAYSMAAARLAKSAGYSERIHFNAIVNPAHEVGDVVTVTRAKSKINNNYVLDQLSIPLTKDRAMDAVTRLRSSIFG